MAATTRGAATRTRLLEATRRVVADVGYPHATTKAIAEAAGVAEGTIYRHFPDKAELFIAAVMHANAPVVEWMAGLPARAGSADVAANLAEALQRLAELREDMVPLELAMLTDPVLAQRRREVLQDMAGRRSIGGMPDPPLLLAEYLAAEQRLGRVRADLEPTTAAVTIMAALIGLAVLPQPPGAADLTGALADILVRGVQV